MGLPKPLGPYSVAFADFELRRTEGVHGGMAASTPTHGKQSNPDFVMLADAQGAPLTRIFYPTSHPLSERSPSSHRRWIPSIMYTWGYLSKMVPPFTCFHRLLIWILAGIVHILVCLGAVIQASINTPILRSREEAEEGRFPIVIFSHGLWACRTTYSAFCCDLASHGYIVAALEHLDGSANIASYTDHNGKRKWLENSFAKFPPSKISIQDRSKQLKQRILEVRKVIDVLESIDRGLLTQNSNTITGKTALDISMLQGQLDLHYIAVAGHSFGGATAIVASGIDKRIKCCIGMDVWWEPIDQADYNKLAGKVPVLLLNTQNFDWKALREARTTFLNKRDQAKNDGRPLITEILTIKDTSHQDQSDFTMLFPKLMKKLGVAGALDPVVTKDINSRACLRFLHKCLLPPGTGPPYSIAEVREDEEHIATNMENSVQ